MAVDRPVATSAVNALKTLAFISVLATTGCPVEFMTKVPELLYDKVILLNSLRWLQDPASFAVPKVLQVSFSEQVLRLASDAPFLAGYP